MKWIYTSYVVYYGLYINDVIFSAVRSSDYQAFGLSRFYFNLLTIYNRLLLRKSSKLDLDGDK